MTRGIVAERVRVRELRSQEGSQLLRIVRRDSGSVVTWRRAQMVLLAAQGMPAPRIAEVTFASEDRVRDVIHNFNLDGLDSLYPRYQGRRPPTFTLAQRQRIKKLALSQAAYQRLDAAGNDLTAVFAAMGEMLFWIVYGQWGVGRPPPSPEASVPAAIRRLSGIAAGPGRARHGTGRPGSAAGVVGYPRPPSGRYLSCGGAWSPSPVASPSSWSWPGSWSTTRRISTKPKAARSRRRAASWSGSTSSIGRAG